MKQIVIIMGSKTDAPFAQKIKKELKKLKISFSEYVASAHKEPKKLLEIIKKYNQSPDKICYITIAGRSNALSGLVAAQSRQPVIACPPFKNQKDYIINIHSTLQMPSCVPVLTVIDPKNTALAAARILSL